MKVQGLDGRKGDEAGHEAPQVRGGCDLAIPARILSVYYVVILSIYQGLGVYIECISGFTRT